MSNLLHLWKHIAARRRRQFFLLFVLMVSTSFAEVASIGAVMPFLGALTKPNELFGHAMAQPVIRLLNLTEPDQLLLPLTVIFSLSAILSGLMRLVLLWTQTHISHVIGADLSISIYRRTLYQPYTTHVLRNSSEVIAGVSQKANEAVHLIILPVLIIFSSGIMLLAILSVLCMIDPLVAISAVSGFGAIYAMIIGLSKNRLKRNSQRVALEQGQVIKMLQEGLGGIRNVLLDGTQETYCKIYRSADLPLRQARAKIQIISGSPRFGIESLGMVLIAVLAFTLSKNESEFASAIPVLGALGLGAQRLLPVLQQAYANWALFRGGQASLRDTLDLLDQPMPRSWEKPLSVPIQFKENIVLDRLNFRYSSSGPQVLKGVKLTIEKGSRVGFIGPTGSGKSTLLDIIMGLLAPSEGKLKIDGREITRENRRAWQAHIAHVPQSIFLADATIAENIALGIPVEKIDICRVRDAAKRAQISDTIESLDMGYNSRVGEHGLLLSGGQRQRIGIARALYKKVDVLIFDEATSALDEDTECRVMEAIESIGGEITVIIVAHRVTTLKNCSRIVELRNGAVNRTGKYRDFFPEKEL